MFQDIEDDIFDKIKQIKNEKKIVRKSGFVDLIKKHCYQYNIEIPENMKINKL